MLRQILHSYKRLTRRKELAVISGVVLLLILIVNYVSFESITDYDYEKTIDSMKDKLPALPEIPEIGFPTFFEPDTKDKGPENNQRLYRQVFEIIKDADPQIPRLDRFRSEERLPNIRFDEETDVVFSKEYLSKFLDVNQDEVEILKKSHSQVIAKFPGIVASSYYKGTGIVYVGGGKFNWLALMSIKTLRNLGSTLPVEVLIPTNEDYEVDLCEHIFPALNAKCLLLPLVLGSEIMDKFNVGGFQYKALAILVSSFESLLLLDADNIPVYIPDHIFRQDPFKTNGLVIWPDFWRRTTSPDFYTIVGINVTDERVMYGVTEKEKTQTEVPYHHFKNAIPDPTSESGQVLINKTQHLDTMFLSLYYNIYGPLYYYPLLSQGALGEGDKETFITAAVALGKPFYQMHENLVALGRFDNNENFHGVAMGQFDPVQDYEKHHHEGTRDDVTDPRILFIHANFPKLDPVLIKNEGKLFSGDERVRIYGPNMASRIGYDFETYQWNNMDYLLCQEKINLKIFEKENITEICQDIHLHQFFLKSTITPLWKGQVPQR